MRPLGPMFVALLVLAGLGPTAHMLVAGDPDGKTDPTPEALVDRLNSPNFQERESAARALRALGAKAVPALTAGLRGGSPEAVERCRRVLADIRKDELGRFLKAFAADTGRKARFDHPVWVRWAKVAGDDRPSRELFAEVLAVPGAAEALDRLAADPKAAATVYPAELGRLHAVALPRGLRPGGQIWSLASCYSFGEAVYGVYLGTYPGAASVPPSAGRAGLPDDPEMEVVDSVTHLLYRKRGPWSAEAVAKGEYQAGNQPLERPKNRILAAALLNLKNPRTIEHGLRRDGGLRDVRGDELAACLPLVRMVCREQAFPIAVRAASWPYLAEAGEVDYLPDMRAFQTDATRVQQLWRSDEKNREYNVLESDVSIACQLVLHKRSLKDFGFLEKLNTSGRAVDKSCDGFGFPDDATRQAAHARALAFLEKAGTPKPAGGKK